MKTVTIKAAVRSILICLMFIGLALPAANASAALRSCRTDPILTFSDGSKLTVTATINTDAANITQVVYTVHVPAGLSLVQAVYTAGSLGGKESVIVIADQNPGVYRTDTLVTTRVRNVEVQAVTSLNPAIYGSANGYNGDHLVVTLYDTMQPASDSWMTPNYATCRK